MLPKKAWKSLERSPVCLCSVCYRLNADGRRGSGIARAEEEILGKGWRASFTVSPST